MFLPHHSNLLLSVSSSGAIWLRRGCSVPYLNATDLWLDDEVVCTYPAPLYGHTHFLSSLRAAIVLNAGHAVPAPPPLSVAILQDFNHTALVDGIDPLKDTGTHMQLIGGHVHFCLLHSYCIETVTWSRLGCSEHERFHLITFVLQGGGLWVMEQWWKTEGVSFFRQNDLLSYSGFQSKPQKKIKKRRH